MALYRKIKPSDVSRLSFVKELEDGTYEGNVPEKLLGSLFEEIELPKKLDKKVEEVKEDKPKKAKK